MVEVNSATQNYNQLLENYEIELSERFICFNQSLSTLSFQEQDQVCPSTTEINYSNSLAGVSEYDNLGERDLKLAEIFEKLTGNENNQSEGVRQMLRMFKRKPHFISGTKDRILSSVGNWHTFIWDVDRMNRINLQKLEEGMDERVRTLIQIDQRIADLYLRCKFTHCQSYRSYQFIFKDGSRSQCDQNTCNFTSFWRDHMIPDEKEISTVQMMFNKSQGYLYGLRFLQKNGMPILTCGRMIEDPSCFETTNCLIKEFNLQEDQRIVGFKSVSGNQKCAYHEDFQFLLITPVTKTVLLKLLANKSQVGCFGRGLGKIPVGVFRELIRFVRY